MTTSIASEVTARAGRPRRARTLAEDLVAEGTAALARAEARNRLSFHWPSERYRSDPASFCREILGITPWARQIEILEAVRDHRRVAVSSGHKIGKSATAAILAWWFYCSYEDARVIFTSTTSRQVDTILWRELLKIKMKSGRCVDCRKKHEAAVAACNKAGEIPRPCPHSGLLDGESHELARSGHKAIDFREITGFTAREAEAVAGVSGANLLYIPDEASGIPPEIFRAMNGNRAGGGRMVMFSNPTRTDGDFFEAFDTKKELWKTFQISSREVTGLGIPGLCTKEWIDEMEIEHGKDSAEVMIRVDGKFAQGEDGKCISLHAIIQSNIRWYDTPADGPLIIGIDPAGEGQAADETAFAMRRGKKVLSVLAFRGLDEGGIIAQLAGIIATHGHPREVTTVVLDREGAVGARVYGAMRAWAENNEYVQICGERVSEKPKFDPRTFGRRRDEIWSGLAMWLKEGGALPEDAKLSKELHAPSWFQDEMGRQKVTRKEEMRQGLGRSPDRADAVCLAVTEPSISKTADGPPQGQTVAQTHYEPAAVIDPYAGLEAWGRNGGNQ